MKQLKCILISSVLGLLLGLALGINIGHGRAWLSNPFAPDSLTDQVKRFGSETLQQSGKALEKTGQVLQGK